MMGLGQSIIGLISGALDPIKETVDELHTSEEEREKVKLQLTRMENDLASKVVDYEKELLESRAKLVGLEIQGESWLQRNWRPVLMLTIVAIVANNYLIFPYLVQFWSGARVLELPTGLWTLMTTGVGGYVLGRSGEKVSKTLKERGK